MSFGQGMVMSYSWKHKINTKSSTEAEIVGVDDSLGYILWARYFMIEQGYEMDASLLYQDNMSAILLETNGRASSSKRTKHIKVKYFFVKDKVDQGEITIEHCPTEQMWTDINTKPKQGLVFRAFRGHVMGIPADYKDSDYEGKVPLTPVMSMLPLTRCGASLGGAVDYIPNPTLRLFSHTFLHISCTRLHTRSDDNQTRRYKKH
jgi:hypothetical protein